MLTFLVRHRNGVALSWAGIGVLAGVIGGILWLPGLFAITGIVVLSLLLFGLLARILSLDVLRRTIDAKCADGVKIANPNGTAARSWGNLAVDLGVLVTVIIVGVGGGVAYGKLSTELRLKQDSMIKNQEEITQCVVDQTERVEDGQDEMATLLREIRDALRDFIVGSGGTF